MTSLSFAMMGAGILSGMLYNRAGPRLLCIAAGAFLTAGYFLMTRLHINTPAGYVVASLVLIGFGLGLMITPVSNMIMNSVTKTKQGMISSLTSLERFVPLTLGIAAFNLIFIQGVLAIASGHSVLTTSPADIKMQVLAPASTLRSFFRSCSGSSSSSWLLLSVKRYIRIIAPGPTILNRRLGCSEKSRQRENNNNKIFFGCNPVGCCYGDSNPSRERERLA